MHIVGVSSECIEFCIAIVKIIVSFFFGSFSFGFVLFASLCCEIRCFCWLLTLFVLSVVETQPVFYATRIPPFSFHWALR